MVLSLIDPCDFFPQPNRISVSDMDYCFIRSKTTRGDVRSRYPDAFNTADSSARVSSLSSDASLSSREEDTRVSDFSASSAPISSLLLASSDASPVEVITCYYYNDSGKLSVFTFCDGYVLSDIEGYYSRKRRICERCQRPIEHCSCSDGGRPILTDDPIETLKSDIILDRGGVDERCIPATLDGKPTSIPRYSPNRIPIVLRVNISHPDRWYGQSDCEFIRPYQQEINKIESRIHEKLMRSSVIPVLPAESEFRLDNSINSKILRLREGEDKGMYGTISTQADVSQDIEAAERVYQMAKRCMGISDSFQGYADDTALSGRAKEIQVAQSAGRMASKRVMKRSALAEIDRLIFELYLAFSDEPRPLTFIDPFGIAQNDAFNRFAFLERDTLTGSFYYNDDFLFSCDDTSDSKLSRDNLWESTVNHFREGIFGDPSSTSSILRLWQSLERLRHPLGRFNVEYFSSLCKGDTRL